MLRKQFYLSVFALFHVISGYPQQALPPIGQWRDFLPYKTAIDVTAGNNRIFCATPFSFFSVDLSENSIDRYSKVNGLHETGISALEYNQQTEKLLVAYSNSNIDLVYRGDIFNIPDIKRSAVQADKSIFSIYPYQNDFYLSTGLGIVIINGDKYEVKDTWRIGDAGNYRRVSSFTAANSFFYAATEEGLKRVPISGSNPSDYNNWQLLSGLNGLPPGDCRHVITVQNMVIAQVRDSLFIQNGSGWSLFYASTGGSIFSVSTSENKIFVNERINSASRILVLTASGIITETIQPGISNPNDIISVTGNYWIADGDFSLLKYNGSAQSYRPDSPDSTSTGEMFAKDNTFYAASGSVSDQWQPRKNTNGIAAYEDGGWTNYNSWLRPVFDTLPDFISLAQDETNGTLWAGSFGGGLVHIESTNIITVYKQNSSLQPVLTDPGSYRVAGLAFDDDRNLWISNYGGTQALKVLKKDNSWQSFGIPFSLVDNAVSQIIIDDLGQKWIVSPGGNGLICFNDNNTIDNKTDDRWKLFRAGMGSGNLPSSNLLCIANDKNGFIWVGTDDGIGVIQCPYNVFDQQACEAVWPIVPQGNFAGYLFKGTAVRSIAVDGADRKWVATPNGVFLISAEGEKVIYHFNETNSPLLNNDVKKVTIDSKTGEVYFATVKGICSFRSTATEGQTTNSNVLVFPNPVPPGYGGTIAIKGLVENAIVKITEMDGRLVYQTRSLGGQAVWDGKDYRGRRISTGIYLVLVSDDNRQEKAAAKIVFISR